MSLEVEAEVEDLARLTSIYDELHTGLMSLASLDADLEPLVERSLSVLLEEPPSMRALIRIIDSLEVDWTTLSEKLLETIRKLQVARGGVSEHIIALAEGLRPVYDPSQVLL